MAMFRITSDGRNIFVNERYIYKVIECSDGSWVLYSHSGDAIPISKPEAERITKYFEVYSCWDK